VKRKPERSQIDMFEGTASGRRAPIVRAYFAQKQLVADNFAGGGGASFGIKSALGRGPDIAVNHNPFALAVHRANHPETSHYCENVYKVDPVKACGGQEVVLAWFSPDCTHHSNAKGGKPVDQKIRGLAWSMIPWASKVRPEHIGMENVQEFLRWGPLHRDHSERCNGRNGKLDRKTKLRGCRRRCHFQKPIKERAGETFRALVSRLEKFGYTVRWWVKRACDYGAPTSRRRLILWASLHGEPACPAATHGPESPEPYRTAAECIDWDIPCPSIFGRKKPLVEKTERRIARGLVDFVLESARPFLVSVNHSAKGGDDAAHRVHDVDAPIPTITGGQRGAHALVTPHMVTLRGTEDSHVEASASSVEEPLRTIAAQGNHHYLAAPLLVRTAHGDVDARGKRRGRGAHTVKEPLPTVTASRDFGVAVPYLVHRGNGERTGQAPRIYDIEKPLTTVVAQGQKHALCAAFLEKGFSERDGGWAGGQRVDQPISTITTRDHHRLVEVTLSKEQLRGARRVYAFLMKYYSAELGQAQSVDRPLGTITAKARFGLVTVTIEGEEWIVVDIGMRMLTARELYRCQGFPDDYVIDPIGPNGKRITKTDQIRMCGNSVPPQLAAAFVRANLLERPLPQRNVERWRAAA
jgi:DNA (cytosine-5)-methyltransferase 1